jgi:glycogen debranching enzyme
MNSIQKLLIPAALILLPQTSIAQIPAFPLAESKLTISRPTQPADPFTVAGDQGVIVGTQDGQFESWILPVKLLSHLTIEANLEGYTVPIPVNPQSANIEVRPDHTTITYSHAGFTIRQIMFSPDKESGVSNDAGVPQVSNLRPGMDIGATAPRSGPIVLFQIDAVRPLDLVFRFTPEMRWMWPKRNEGIPSPDWIPATQQHLGEAEPPQSTGEGFYMLNLDYPDLAGAITIPTATPGILAPYQERPQVHPLELRLHYDPKRDGTGVNARYFPLLMAVATSAQTATPVALGKALQRLNASIPDLYKAHAAHYAQLESETTSIETPDKALNEAFKWGVVSIEQLKARVPTFSDSTSPEAHDAGQAPETALVAGYYASADSARPGFGWFFGRDALYTLYAVNGFGDFALTRSELEFLIARQRADGKIMHEYSQTAADPSVDWKQFPYMYAAADATPLFLMAIRDYYRASGDLGFLQAHREAIEKAWSFETAASSDTDHDGIYDNSQGTGWVESWPHAMPHQEIYLALLDQQASSAYSAIESALGDKDKAESATGRAAKIHSIIESEYYDPAKNCYAFSHNPDGTQDKASTVYPAIAYWDTGSSLAHPEACLQQWASPTIATDWGLRDVATTEPFYDGLSYHQGSVWPLFTGWGALAEYRANQPLAGEQMLMRNVDLTWAQDPGAVTELLSGDFFVPFGRSTSHQLWSSAMVITPTLRGLFGISLDAATNTITVNPHLPANWDHAQISNLHFAGQQVTLLFRRDNGRLEIELRNADKNKPLIHLLSDLPGTQAIPKPRFSATQLSIPLPPLELSSPTHSLPTPGARPGQMKILSTTYGPRSLTVKLSAQPGTDQILTFNRNQPVAPHLSNGVNDKSGLVRMAEFSGAENKEGLEPSYVRLRLPEGQGWQTLEFTLTW